MIFRGQYLEKLQELVDETRTWDTSLMIRLSYKEPSVEKLQRSWQFALKVWINYIEMKKVLSDCSNHGPRTPKTMMPLHQEGQSF